MLIISSSNSWLLYLVGEFVFNFWHCCQISWFLLNMPYIFGWVFENSDKWSVLKVSQQQVVRELVIYWDIKMFIYRKAVKLWLKIPKLTLCVTNISLLYHYFSSVGGNSNREIGARSDSWFLGERLAGWLSQVPNAE